MAHLRFPANQLYCSACVELTHLQICPFLQSHILPIMPLSSPLSFPFSLTLRYRFEMWCVFFLSIQTWHLPLSCFSESIAYLPSFSPLSATGGTMVHLLALCLYTGFDTAFFHVVNRPSSFLIFPTLTFCFMLKYWWIFQPPCDFIMNNLSTNRELLGKKHHLTVAWVSSTFQIGPHP